MEVENEKEHEEPQENNISKNEEQKIPFSLQGEINLVNEEEEENKNGPTQKERLQKMLNKLNERKEEKEEKGEKENENNKDEEIENSEKKVILRGVKKVLAKTTPTKLIVKKEVKEPFDMTFNLEDHYFYKTMPEKEWDEIVLFLQNFLKENNENENENIEKLKNFFVSHQDIKKGNIEALFEKIYSLNSASFSPYQSLIKFLINEYYQPKPVICECYFFPDPSNEEKVVSMLRTCKKTLDIAIFSLTLDSIAEAILEAFQRGIKVRVIADDECAKNKGSNIKLVASVGVPTKTDNAIYHMHHKFAVIDSSVVIMGSFNWTGQAVKYNQENIFFYEDKNIAYQYAQEFERLWNSFNTVIDQKQAQKDVENEEKEQKEKEKAKMEKKEKKEKEKKETTKTTKDKKLEKKEKSIKQNNTKRVRGIKK